MGKVVRKEGDRFDIPEGWKAVPAGQLEQGLQQSLGNLLREPGDMQGFQDGSVLLIKQQQQRVYDYVQRGSAEAEYEIPRGWTKLSSQESDHPDAKRFMEMVLSQNLEHAENYNRDLLAFTKKEDDILDQDDDDADTREKVTSQSIRRRKYKF